MPDKSNLRHPPAGDPHKVWLDTTFAADVAAISPVVERVMAIAREMKFPEGKEGEIGLALQEALANAVKHGCKNDSNLKVQCTVTAAPSGGMLIVVRDSGSGFDPANIPSPKEGENIFFDHGRGIFMINQLMDEVHYERGGTELHMRKSNKP
ncbi:MAG: ATP-binding protein [Terriglobales bacterium]